MEIKHAEKENAGKFIATANDGNIGEMTYRMEAGGIMAIDHTEVISTEQGNNVGLQLLDFAADFARKENIRIKPLCKFVKVMFQKHRTQYQDVTLI